jgi:hypothetical protein
LARGDQVGGADRLGAEAQVRGGHGAGLLGVVDEVALGVVFGVFGADDLDGVLVGAHGAVGAEAVEEGADGRGLRWRRSGIVGRLVWLTSSLMPTVKWFGGPAWPARRRRP